LVLVVNGFDVVKMTLENSDYLNYSDDNMQIARCQGVCHFVVRSLFTFWIIGAEVHTYEHF
jgi:hypothetical protein